jgi:ligand-binding sensor domain-containing protein
MKNTGSLVAIIAVTFLCFVVIIFASLKKRPVIVENNATADEVATPASAALDSEEFGGGYLPEVTTVLVDNGRLVIGTDNGLFVMPHIGKVADSAAIPERVYSEPELLCLNTILPYGDSRFAGDYTGLYKLDDDYTMIFESYYPDESVYALLEFGDGILVGTDRGLWYHCDTPAEGLAADIIEETSCYDTLLLDGVIVTALAADYSGIWVGTYGDGLFFGDGSGWKSRHLLRDTTSFAFVNALEYRYPYLWVGTEKAIYRYNGGRWAQMFVADSSEFHAVTTITSTAAATYIGTENGLLWHVYDTLLTVPEYEGKAIAAICSDGKEVIVATRKDGIFTFKGKEEIVSPEQLTFQALPGDITNEVLAETEY